MIRVLVMIAVTGFLVSVVTLSTAVAIGGPDILTSGVWNHWNGDWSWGWSDHDNRWGRARDSGPETTREIAWTGGDTLELDVPADVQYTQAPGPGKVTISGPQSLVSEVEVDGGQIRFAHRHHGIHGGNLVIAITAPAVNRFDVSGSGKLSIADYRQDKLTLDLSGNADVEAAGEAKALELTVSGSSDTDLSGLKLETADVDIAGSGDATLAPTGSANLNVSGSGDVTLLSRPARLESNVTGSGSIHQQDGVSPSPPPSPPPSPKHGKRL
jgi:Putative auto-transporter adhesin, head GIN domain